MKKIFSSTTCFLILFYILSLPCQAQSSPSKAPKVVSGVIDLTHWDFEKGGAVPLDGEWEFYWKQLLSPPDFHGQSPPQKTGLIEVPGTWNSYEAEGGPLSGDGYATYRLTIKVDQSKKFYAVKLLAMATAYRIWGNGKELASNGVVGKSRETMVPQYLPTIAILETEGMDEIEIVMQISNFYHRKGGFWERMELGTISQIHQARERQIAFDLFLFGTLMIMAIYHFGLYSLRRKDASTLYFGIFCFIISIRIVVMTERYITTVFPDWNWGFLIKVEYLSFYLGLPPFALFLRNLYPQEVSKRITQVIVALGGIFGLIVVILPAKLFTETTLAYQLITLIACIYALYVLVLATIRKRDGAFGAITGFLILFVTVVNDVLNGNEIISTGYLAPFGLFMFIFAQSFILSLRFARVFASVEKLSATFQKFVPLKFLNRIAKGGIENIQLGNAESSFTTVLFSDIRSFTTFSEKVTPQELMNFLNAYFKRMNQPIHENNGIIDKFIGDAIMALFDRPDGTDADEAEDAVKASISMMEALNTYNQHRNNSGYSPISIGIGIHSGPVIIGTVGSDERMDSTVLGDVVNVGSRLEGLTKYYRVPIIISSTTHDLLKGNPAFLCRKLDFVSVKGKEEPLGIYEVFNCDPEPIRRIKQEILSSYQEGLQHYTSRNWDEALQRFKECLKVYPDDPLSQLYLERCNEYKNNPPGDDWDGTLHMVSK